MSRKRIDLTGKTFGYLQVVERAENSKSNRTQWKCKCKCGKEVIVSTSNLRKGHTKSCGCLKIEKASKKNTYIEKENYMIGYTQEGQKFYFSKQDYKKIKPYYWSINCFGYIQAKINKKAMLFHRFILNPEHTKVIDHINHNTVDNRRENLRIVTAKENNENRSITKRNTSGIVGVSWVITKNKWMAHIGTNRQKISLGYFNDFEEAVKARQKAEAKFFKPIPKVPQIKDENI